MKINCPACGGIKSASAGPYKGLWVVHCHRCGETLSKPLEVPLRPVEAPTGAPREIKQYHEPSETDLAWLGRYGVSWRDAQKYGLYAGDNRLWFPGGGYLIGRDTTGLNKPKWLTLRKEDIGSTPVLGWGFRPVVPHPGLSGVTVVTEDSMASLKAALAGLHGFPLLGTSVNQINPLAFSGRKILHLLDPDQAGYRSGQKLQWLLRGLPYRSYSIKEPKEYSLDQIRALAASTFPNPQAGG